MTGIYLTNNRLIRQECVGGKLDYDLLLGGQANQIALKMPFLIIYYFLLSQSDNRRAHIAIGPLLATNHHRSLTFEVGWWR